MMRKHIPAEELIAAWREDPKFVDEYNALEEEFALAATLIEARTRANLTQQQVADRMGTTQAAVARLESGHLPSTRTLERYAKATGHRLSIALVPTKASA